MRAVDRGNPFESQCLGRFEAGMAVDDFQAIDKQRHAKRIVCDRTYKPVDLTARRLPRVVLAGLKLIHRDHDHLKVWQYVVAGMIACAIVRFAPVIQPLAAAPRLRELLLLE